MGKVPLLLTALRAVLAPIVVALAAWYPSRALFGACLGAAFLSDVFDGIIARRLGIATATLRRLDSIADSAFYLCAALAVWLLYPQVILRHLPGLLVLVLLEAVRYVVDFLKFGKEASYHMWSSKLWGIFLFLGFLSLLAFGQDGLLVTCAIYLGVLADVEGLLISLTLREWQTDVPSLFLVLRQRAAGSTAAQN